MPEHTVAGHERRQRHLPHWETAGDTYFITFCLARPPALDLTDPRVAPLVLQALRHWDDDRYALYDFTVMPDHVHAIVRPQTDGGRAVSLSRVLHGLKSWTAQAVNQAAGRSGSCGSTRATTTSSATRPTTWRRPPTSWTTPAAGVW